MKKLLFLGFISAILALPAHAALKIFATVPEWGALAQEIGGSRVSVYTATTGLQDPHRVDAKPSLIARARSAQLVVATGAELEIGWLPVVLRESGNREIQPGRPGYFEAAGVVAMRDVPQVLDRAHGDVHAGGNPHIQMDPRNILKVAESLTARMVELDPVEAMAYRSGLQEFSVKWQAAIQRWQKEAASLKGIPVLVQHDAFSYLNAWLGMKQAGVLEPKPGVEPSGAFLADMLARQQAQPARMVLRPAYQYDTPARWMAERAKIPAVTLPFTVGGTPEASDLFSLFDDTIRRLLAGLQQK
ncbi:MAG: zinc ABC transporter substrate-binding protein [Zoogloeaceae bacterium]|nr:zinc ABC transporter substrate-binding protein [Zoogloeaceae bacterium]